MNIDDYRSRLEENHKLLENIYSTANSEGRDLTDEERVQADDLIKAQKVLRADMDRLHEKLELDAIMDQTSGRISEPNEIARDPEPKARAAAPQAAVAQTPPVQPRKVYAQPRDMTAGGTHGFPTFGHFARAVMMAARPGNPVIDERFRNAPSDPMREGSGEDGGFLVPPDYRTAILNHIQGEDSLLARTDRMVTSSNVWSQPVDNSTPWNTASGGIKAVWTAEGAQKDQSRLNLTTLSLRLHKLAAIVPVTDELREDASSIDAYITRKAPEAFNWAINQAIIRGTGVGQPEGILNSPALVTVAKEVNQTAATLHARNIAKMWSRLHANFRGDAVWLVNQDVETELPMLAEAAKTADGATVVGPAATYWEPGSIRNQNNFGLLYNRPVIVSEACAPLGTVGDIILASLSKYVTATKVGGLRTDISIHLWFDYDVTAFRFVFRVAGASALRAPISRADPGNTNTWSAFVALATRAG